jgi:predicted RND superfamily exporter protein
MGEAASDRVLAEVTTRVDRVRARMPDLRIAYGGDIPTAIAERDALLDDIGIVSIVATLLVFGSIVVFFRSFKALVYVGTGASLGTALAFALASLAFGRLNAATSFLGSVVIGNGINYGIVYLARYFEMRREGRALEAALADAAVTCWRGTWLAALAASLAYFSLTATSFRGFSEFGWIGGIGMIACWLGTFLVLPACVARFETGAPNPLAPARARRSWRSSGRARRVACS